jgi:hypothetical protein
MRVSYARTGHRLAIPSRSALFEQFRLSFGNRSFFLEIINPFEKLCLDLWFDRFLVEFTAPRDPRDRPKGSGTHFRRPAERPRSRPRHRVRGSKNWRLARCRGRGSIPVQPRDGLHALPITSLGPGVSSQNGSLVLMERSTGIVGARLLASAPGRFHGALASEPHEGGRQGKGKAWMNLVRQHAREGLSRRNSHASLRPIRRPCYRRQCERGQLRCHRFPERRNLRADHQQMEPPVCDKIGAASSGSPMVDITKLDPAIAAQHSATRRERSALRWRTV